MFGLKFPWNIFIICLLTKNNFFVIFESPKLIFNCYFNLMEKQKIKKNVFNQTTDNSLLKIKKVFQVSKLNFWNVFKLFFCMRKIFFCNF